MTEISRVTSASRWRSLVLSYLLLLLVSMPAQRRNDRDKPQPQTSARHLYSAVVEKRQIDVRSLDAQQRSVLDVALSGQSLLVTGGAG